MKALAIGKKIVFRNVTLEVVPSTDWSCIGCCFFEMIGICCIKELRDVIELCDKYNRTDGKDVIFRAVKGKED